MASLLREGIARAGRRFVTLGRVRRRWTLSLALVAALVAVVASYPVTTLFTSPAAHAAARTVPFGFLGVMADGVLLNPLINVNSEMGVMAQTGVESVRLGVYWSVTQPYPNFKSVPSGQTSQYQNVGGVPTSWAASDRLYAAAAAHGLRVLPVILQAPPWAAMNPAQEWSPPKSAAAYGRFVALVVQRYGPNGTFWKTHPSLTADPSTQWQIWNEPAGGNTPNGASLFWASPVPFQNPYIAMLRAAHTAVKANDPGGQVVLAGLFGRGWLALQSLYQHGAKGLFDAVAINIFTRYPSNVILALQYTRQVMKQYGDGALPIMATEFSWPSALGHVPEAADKAYGYDTTLTGEATDLSRELSLMEANRVRLNLQQVFWYTWITRDAANNASFEYAGLRHLDQTTLQITPKPAQFAYREAAVAIEGCAKSTVATQCQ